MTSICLHIPYMVCTAGEPIVTLTVLSAITSLLLLVFLRDSVPLMRRTLSLISLYGIVLFMRRTLCLISFYGIVPFMRRTLCLISLYGSVPFVRRTLYPVF